MEEIEEIERAAVEDAKATIMAVCDKFGMKPWEPYFRRMLQKRELSMIIMSDYFVRDEEKGIEPDSQWLIARYKAWVVALKELRNEADLNYTCDNFIFVPSSNEQLNQVTSDVFELIADDDKYLDKMVRKAMKKRRINVTDFEVEYVKSDITAVLRKLYDDKDCRALWLRDKRKAILPP